MKYALIVFAFLTLSYEGQGQNTSPWPATGNVGIGTASPDYLLQVHSSNTPTFAIGKGNLNTNGKSSLLFNAGDGTAFNGFWINYFKTTATDRLGFVDGGAVERMSILNGGNVGIGTSSPSARLNIYNQGSPTNMVIGNPSTGSGGFTSLSMGTSADNNGYSFIYGIKSSGSAYGDISLNQNGGNVGIGTTTPTSKLDVRGGIVAKYPTGNQLSIQSNVWRWDFDVDEGSGNNFRLRNMTSATVPFIVTTNGNVGIGTTNPNQKLTVNGTIYGKEVKVDLSVPGPDYVFANNYQLQPLSELKTYIDQNKHLPEVPSAAAMEANGINLGEMNMLLLRKIEELTLYIIDQRKELDELKQRSVSPDPSGKKVEELTLYVIEQNKRDQVQKEQIVNLLTEVDKLKNKN